MGPAAGRASEAQWNAVAACPRVATIARSGRVGTGVTVAVRDGAAYVLTAEHVVPGVEDRLVEFFNKDSYPKPASQHKAVEVVKQWTDPDLALLKVEVGKGPIPALRLAGPGERPKRYPFAALSVGCTEGAAPTCRTERVLARRPVRRPNEVAFFWELQTPSIAGRSGGPLLDRDGRVIGICVALQSGRGYFSHLDEIQAVLKRDDLDWLWRPETASVR